MFDCFYFCFFLGSPNVRGLCPLLILISASAGTILSLDCGGGGCRQLGSRLVLYVFHCIIVSCLALPCCRKGAVHMHSGETVLQFHARETERERDYLCFCLPASFLPLAEQLTARQMEMPRLLGYCCQQLKDFICSLLLPHLLRVFVAATAVSI